MGASEIVEVDERQWPLVIFAVREPSLEAAISLNRAVERCFQRRQRFAAVFDLQVKSLPDAKARAVLGEFQKKHLDDFARWVVADVTVVRNRLVRGVVIAINWFAPPKHPVFVCESVEQAVHVARERLGNETTAAA